MQNCLRYYVIVHVNFLNCCFISAIFWNVSSHVQLISVISRCCLVWFYIKLCYINIERKPGFAFRISSRISCLVGNFTTVIEFINDCGHWWIKWFAHCKELSYYLFKQWKIKMTWAVHYPISEPSSQIWKTRFILIWHCREQRKICRLEWDLNSHLRVSRPLP